MSAAELLAFAIIAAALGSLCFRLDLRHRNGAGLLGAFLLSTAFWLVLAAAAVAGHS